ncbi:MAG: GTPase ObgE [Acidobacteriota bacterium]
MFIDYAKIYVKAGDGGNGCLAFRREKYVPRGGPSGGDGGRGASIDLETTVHLNTLLPFKYKKYFKGQRGGHGSGNNRHGRDGVDLVIKVPVGTQVIEETNGKLIADLDRPGQRLRVARGGKGGRGNAAFATPTRQAPRRFEKGRPGETRSLILELKILADVGLIGLPNAGKSTLISAISAARPEIASYPFTTLTPHLGVVFRDEYSSFVVTDIPGLIEGAHGGSGLGHRFLRHVERTRLLVHLVDVSGGGPEDPVVSVRTIQKELELYSPALARKAQIIAPSKLDSVDEPRLGRLRSFCRRRSLPCYPISAVSGQGVKALKEAMARQLEENPN